jgi:hypothetical protein
LSFWLLQELMDLSEVPLMQAASRSMQGMLGMEPSPQDAGHRRVLGSLAADGGFPVFFLVAWSGPPAACFAGQILIRGDWQDEARPKRSTTSLILATSLKILHGRCAHIIYTCFAFSFIHVFPSPAEGTMSSYAHAFAHALVAHRTTCIPAQVKPYLQDFREKHNLVCSAPVFS